jgi:hypothetical protein
VKRSLKSVFRALGFTDDLYHVIDCSSIVEINIDV